MPETLLGEESDWIETPVVRQPSPEVGAAGKKGKFGVILSDPPWDYRNRSEKGTGRSASNHYQTQGTEWLCALPVETLAAKDSILLLWATNPLLPDALQVVTSWGFTYATMLTWAKMSRAAAPRVGLGYRARACTEHLMIATKGNPPLPATDQRPKGLMFCPIGRHSAKPHYQYDIAEAYEGPYLEMFHRPAKAPQLCGPGREGWTMVGNEVDGLDIREALENLIAERTSR